MIECKDGVFDDGIASLMEDVKNYYYSNGIGGWQFGRSKTTISFVGETACI
jgi:hypothetical protein